MSEDPQWKHYQRKMDPYKYEIGGGILLTIGIFYLIWIGYMAYRAIKTKNERKKADREMSGRLITEYWKYLLTTIGLCLQFGVIASYIMGKIVKSVLIDVHLVNVSTCDSDEEFNTEFRSAIIYYYVESLFQVFAMLFASCMLSTFNLAMTYVKCVAYKKILPEHTKRISQGAKYIILEFAVISFSSIFVVGIPISLVLLFFFILYKFIRFALNSKVMYKVYRNRAQEIGDKCLDEALKRYKQSLESECVHFGYIATVFCFGAGFYIGQLTFDPLASIVEASCTVFPMQRFYIRILYHFMKLLVWGCFAMVAIIYVPFFIPYTFYYVCKVCCPTPVLDFLSRASKCFRKPAPKVHTDLNEPLIPNNNYHE